MNPRKQSMRDLQKQLNVYIRVLTLFKNGEVKNIEPLAKLHLKESIKICRKLLLLT
jgi:hypothetical protein